MGNQGGEFSSGAGDILCPERGVRRVYDEGVYMRLMAIMAHPDDAEIWAGGTICKHVERGDEAFVVYMAATEDSVRGEEAKRGAAIMGAQVAFIGLMDGQVRDLPEAGERVSAILNEFAPDIVITHWVRRFSCRSLRHSRDRSSGVTLRHRSYREGATALGLRYLFLDWSPRPICPGCPCGCHRSVDTETRRHSRPSQPATGGMGGLRQSVSAVFTASATPPPRPNQCASMRRVFSGWSPWALLRP